MTAAMAERDAAYTGVKLAMPPTLRRGFDTVTGGETFTIGYWRLWLFDISAARVRRQPPGATTAGRWRRIRRDDEGRRGQFRNLCLAAACLVSELSMTLSKFPASLRFAKPRLALE